MHGPALLHELPSLLLTLTPPEEAPFVELRRSTEIVVCVRCLIWPPQAADWPTRHRRYGWPDSATVDRVDEQKLYY